MHVENAQIQRGIHRLKAEDKGSENRPFLSEIEKKTDKGGTKTTPPNKSCSVDLTWSNAHFDDVSTS